MMPSIKRLLKHHKLYAKLPVKVSAGIRDTTQDTYTTFSVLSADGKQFIGGLQEEEAEFLATLINEGFEAIEKA